MNTNRRQFRSRMFALMTFGLVSASMVLAATDSVEAQKSNRVVRPNYNQAERYSSRYLRQFVYDSSVRPRWIGKTDKFWYSFRTSNGTKYYRVDPKHATKEDLFDHAKLSSLLSELTRKPLDSARLPITRVSVDDDGSKMKFVVEKSQYEYDLDSEELVKLGKATPQPASSRSGRRTRQTEQKKEDVKKEDVKKEDVKKEDVKKDSEKKDSDKKESDKKDDDKKETDKSTKDKDDKKESEKKSSDKKNKNAKAQKKDSPKKKKDQTDHRSFSPDRTAYVFNKGHDLYFVELPEGYKYEEKSEKKTSGADADSKKESKGSEQKDSKSTEELKSDKKESDKKGDDKKGDDKKESDKKESDKKESDKKESDKKESDKKESDKKESDKKESDKKESDKKESDKKESDKKDDDKKDDDKEDDDKEKPLPIPKIGPDMDATAIRLSKDGEEKFSFVSRFRGRFRGSRTTQQTKEDADKAKERKSKPRVTWSKDSKAFYISRRDSRKVQELFVINSLSDPRPTLEKYSYSMPGEEGVSVSHFYYFSRDVKKLVELKSKWKHESYRGTHWLKEGHKLRFTRADRLLRNVEFCELDVTTGEIKCMITDGFEAANIAAQSARYLKDTEEMIWFSERSGWAHYYLYDMDGNFKNAITSGEFRASQIIEVDEKNRLVYFYGNARENGENVYHNHLYCVRMDGTGLTLLDPGSANHRSTLSPSKKYLVDNCSRVDMAPVSVLRDAQGNEIMKLEESDLSRLKEVGWKMPSTFVVKAADGITNLYGNMWKPFDFNPNKKYPIIAHVYPGPQMEGTSHTFSATAGNQQLAQLGFIVIQVGHRGGTPQRSKAYHSYGYYNLRDYGLADKKAAIEQLAQRFSYVDVERVGIYGHSGGGFMTAAALLREPYNDFFTVGVSTAGNHDNNIYNSSWSERYHGLKEVAVSSRSSSRSRSSSTAKTTVKPETSDMIGDYAAFGPEESDFFFEHEGRLNEDGDFEMSSGHQAFDNPQAFFRQDDEKGKKESGKKSDVKDDKKVGETSEKSKDKTDKKSDDKKKKDESKKTRFEIHVPTNAELAENLKGHLFLVHGEADNNVHPANTLRLVDALIKANKRFDMLYLPATRHGFGRYQPYVTQRMYEYFAEHLLDDYQSAANIGDRK